MMTCRSLPSLGEALARRGSFSRCLVVTQPAVARLYLRPLERGLRERAVVLKAITIPDGERFKTLEVAKRIYHQLAKARVERGDALIALGGGVVGDLTAFVASTYLRGIPCLQVPTTLLAQVDSSIGGKTGVDLSVGKNLVGTFYQPEAVGIDVSTLQTLSEREFRSGLAEVVKYGVIGAPGFLAWLEREKKAIEERNLAKLRQMIEVCCRFKARVVSQDERERTGVRSILNFGHSIGHAVEAAGRYRRYRHGEAISIGIAFALYFGEAIGVTSPRTSSRVTALLRAFRLPTEPPPLSWSSIEKRLRLDKKVRHGELRMILAKRVGAVSLRPVSMASVRTYWNRWKRGPSL